MSSHDPIRELGLNECWEFLAGQELGRLAYQLVDELHLVPINYAIDGQTLLFRTAPGSKLLGVILGAPVAFEVDAVEGETARSVIIRGRARHLPENEEQRADQVPLHPWVDTPKENVVEIVPESITGREFELHRPWRQLRL